MKVTFWLPILAVLLAGSLSAATITYEVAPLGGNNYQYIYGLSGITLSANQGFDIRFDPTLFTSLSNQAGPANFSLFVLQPNNPPGTQGDFEAVAQISNPSPTSPFTINVVYTGLGLPGSQTFSIDTFDSNGNITAVGPSGVTAAVPEPSTLFMMATLLAIVVFGRLRKVRRRGSGSVVRF